MWIAGLRRAGKGWALPEVYRIDGEIYGVTVGNNEGINDVSVCYLRVDLLFTAYII
jgi:hypothetical protein